MKKILFACDLDNTLIYSAKKIPPEKAALCVEYLGDKPQGFMSQATVALLQKITSRVQPVPVTTRSYSQYTRLNWPPGCTMTLALVANGALFLEGGVINASWEEESRRLVQPYVPELTKLRDILAREGGYRHCRLVDDFFLFLACEDEETAAHRRQELQAKTSNLQVEVTGRKIYLIPPELSKGQALRRLQKRLQPKLTLAAGDSEMDLPMLREANMAFVPTKKMGEGLPSGRYCLCEGEELFAEIFLRRMLEMLAAQEKSTTFQSQCNSVQIEKACLLGGEALWQE
ncbi:MAG: HAD family phosphatase [Selenomonadaceae bacterium]|nr:HAD family phosphatase [Selenomonadaceae bacterium]